MGGVRFVPKFLIKHRYNKCNKQLLYTYMYSLTIESHYREWWIPYNLVNYKKKV